LTPNTNIVEIDDVYLRVSIFCEPSVEKESPRERRKAERNNRRRTRIVNHKNVARLPSVAAKRCSIGSSEAAATTATATVTATTITTTAASSAGVTCHFRKTRIDILLGFCQDSDQVAGLFGIISAEERDSGSFSSCATSSTNSMNIIFRVVGVIIVEDMSNVSHIFKYRLAISQW
jgi:hypothetical protein